MVLQKYTNIILKQYGDLGLPINQFCANIIARTVLSIRYFRDQFYFYPKYTTSKMSKESSNPLTLYFPCDMIQLRSLLKNPNKIKNPKCYFTLQFASKHFRDNNIFIGYKINGHNFGQVYISDQICPNIQQIIINDQNCDSSLQNSIRALVQQQNLQIDICGFSSIDKQEKTAQSNETYKISEHKQQYLNRDIKPQFFVGAKVRLNKTDSQVFSNLVGFVKSIKNGRMVVQWTNGKYKGKRSGYDIDDTILLSKLQIVGTNQ